MKVLHHPGDSILHRVPAGAKLVALALCALMLSLAPLGPVGMVVAVIGASIGFGVARLPLRVFLTAWRRLLPVIVILGVALALFVDIPTAVTSTARIVALLLLAELLTATTPFGELLDVLRRMLAPLRRVGIHPEAAALTLSLTIAMIPVMAGIVARVREAQRARGVRLGLRGSVPVLVLALRQADRVGEALAARGLAS